MFYGGIAGWYTSSAFNHFWTSQTNCGSGYQQPVSKPFQQESKKKKKNPQASDHLNLRAESANL